MCSTILSLLSVTFVPEVSAQSTAEKVTKAGDKAVEKAAAATKRLQGLLDRAKGVTAKKAGDKTGDNRWYEVHVPIADRLYDQHLDQLRLEGEIDG